MSVLVAVLTAFTLLAELGMAGVVTVLAPGFADDPGAFALTTELSRITFPYLLCMAAVALLGGVLNAAYRFTAFAAAPVLLNVVLIAVLLAGTDLAATPAHALAWGVFVGGVVQVIVLHIAARRAGLRVGLALPRFTSAVRRLLKLMVPGLIGAGAMQLNIIAGTMIASFLAPGAISYLYYADRVYQLPLGVIGIALGTALLPLLSRQLAGGADAAARDTLNRSLEYAALLTVPAAAACLVIPVAICRVLFERGAFEAADTIGTAQALFAFGWGLPAFVWVKVLQPAYYAHEDTKTPMIHAAISVVANIALALLLTPFFGVLGIAAATAAAGWVNTALLARGLRRRDALAADPRLRRRLWRILAAAAVMAGALLVAALPLAPWLAAGLGLQVAALALLVVGGAAIYFAACFLLGAARPAELAAVLRRSRRGTG
jgi:putative peptidoglycan lipid II flippase